MLPPINLILKKDNKHSRLLHNWKLCASVDTIKKVKKLTEWEKNFANRVSDESLVSRIYKYLLKLNNKKMNNPIF